MSILTKIRINAVMTLIVIGLLAVGGLLFYTISQFFNPLLLLLIIPAWLIYLILKQYLLRTYCLKKNGYFGGGRKKHACVYEEYVNGELLELIINLENTEPGHWELFVPTESEWRSTMPEWARDRRVEIIERILPYFRRSDVHLPDDFKKTENA